MGDGLIGYFFFPDQKQRDQDYERFLSNERKHLTSGWEDEPYPLAERYESYSVWGYHDREGKAINIRNGFRESYEAPCEQDSPRKVLWFFGGSTMFGDGSEDHQTIPSYVCSILAQEMPDVCWECRNFAVGGYVNTQELILFMKLIQEVKPPGKLPNYVVFYDGVNDFLLALRGRPHDHHFFGGIKQHHENWSGSPISKLAKQVPMVMLEMADFLSAGFPLLKKRVEGYKWRK